MLAAWFVWGQGRGGVRPHAGSTNPGICKALAWKEGPNRTNLPVPHGLETLVDGLRLFWWLPWASSGTHGHAFPTLTTSLDSKNNPAFMPICRLPWTSRWSLFLCAQPAVSAEDSIVRALPRLGPQLASCWGGGQGECQPLVSWDVENREVCLKLLQTPPRCLATYPDPT